ARRYEARLADMRQLFDEVSRTLENALALDKALRLPPTYREIARSVGESLDVTYCQIAIHDSPNTLTIRGAGGRRPPRPNGTMAFPLRNLRRCAEALRARRAVVLKLNSNDSRAEPERPAAAWTGPARSPTDSAIFSVGSGRWKAPAALPIRCCARRAATCHGSRSAPRSRSPAGRWAKSLASSRKP